MNLTKYFDYLEDIAARHKEVLHTAAHPHFFRVDIQELDNAFRSKAEWPIIAAVNPIINSTGDGYANIRLRMLGGLLILQKINDRGDFAHRSQAEQKCFQIARDIMLKMINDRHYYDLTNTQYILPGLSHNDFELELIPKDYTSFAGIALRWQWNHPLGQFDPSRWNGVQSYQDQL